MEKKLVLCDTNIIIDFYKGKESIIEALQNIGQQNISISFVTACELIYGALNKQELRKINKDVDNLNTISINDNICKTCLGLMNTYSLSNNLTLPDALIAATAIVYNLPLFTLNLKDFRYIEGLKLYPF